MEKYVFIKEKWIGGQRRAVDSEIELTEAQARNLLRAGIIKKSVPAKNKRVKTEGGVE